MQYTHIYYHTCINQVRFQPAQHHPDFLVCLFFFHVAFFWFSLAQTGIKTQPGSRDKAFYCQNTLTNAIYNDDRLMLTIQHPSDKFQIALRCVLCPLCCKLQIFSIATKVTCSGAVPFFLHIQSTLLCSGFPVSNCIITSIVWCNIMLPGPSSLICLKKSGPKGVVHPSSTSSILLLTI